MNKLALQSIVLDTIKGDINDTIGVIISCSSLNEKIVVSYGEIVIEGEVRWGRGEFIVNIPIGELKDQLSLKMFNEIDSEWWLSFDYEWKSSSDGEFYWESINKLQNESEILEFLSKSDIDFDSDIDRFANEIYRDGDIIDNDYNFSYVYQFSLIDNIKLNDDYTIVDPEWEPEFILALGICADQFFEFKEKGHGSNLHGLLRESLWPEMSEENYSKIWPEGLALRSRFVNGISSWDELFQNIKKFFIEKGYRHSISSEIYLSKALKEMWRSRLWRDDREDIIPQPLYHIEFDGSSEFKPFGYPNWNSGTLYYLDFIIKLDKALGGAHFIKCFCASLDNDYQIFQMAYPLIASSKYMSYDLSLINFILKFNFKGFPFLNKLISENPYYAENCWDSLNKEDAFTIAGLTASNGNYDSISQYVSLKEFKGLSDSISKRDIKLCLLIEENHRDYGEDYEEFDGDESKVFKPIEALFHLECGNLIEFDSFIFDNKNKSDDLTSQLNTLMEYIFLYRNNFYKQLMTCADRFFVHFDNENGEEKVIVGSEYLEAYGKWELIYGELILKSDNLFGEFKHPSAC